MRTLSSTLLAAQREASSVPFVQVTVSGRIAGVPLLRWERLYSGGEPDCWHAAAMAGDGSLLRLRVDPAGPVLYYQRVPAPGPGSPFGSWTNLGAVANAGVAIAAAGAAVIRAFVAPDGVTILVQDSADYGAAFGSSVSAASSGTAIGWLAAALKSDGTAFLIYSAGSTIYTVKRVSGSWGAPSAWPYSASEVRGLAAAYAGDYDLAIAAAGANGEARLWTAVYGDGFEQSADTWSPLREVTTADSGSDVSLRAPSLASLDTHRLFFVEEYGGIVAYSRPQWTWMSPSQTFAANAWREPAPFDLTTSFGVAVTGDTDYAWCSTPSGVWRAPLGPPELDVSQDVLELTTQSRRSGGTARVVLRNDDGRYNDLSSTPYSSIRPGSELAVSPGYVTGAGPEVSPGPRYWIEGWEHTSAGGEATFVLYARDAWSLVERWRARRQYVWPAGAQSISQILRFVVGRAGIELIDVGSSATATGHRPAFAIHPGEDGLRVVGRLLAMAPDVILVSGESAFLFEPTDTDEAVYSYGTVHPILRARHAWAGLPGNRVQVFGQDVMAEGFDWNDIESRLDWLRQVHDMNVTSVGLAEDRAAATLRQQELSLARGELASPVNCGQELFDVVSVTDPQAGFTAAKYRVAGLDLRYLRRGGSPAYEQRLLLGSV